MEQLLEKLFESVPKVRLLRLFMQNQDTNFPIIEIVRRTKLPSRSIRSELNKLLKIGLIKSKIGPIPLDSSSGKKHKIKKAELFFINSSFPIIQELHTLTIRSLATSRIKLLRQIKSLGKIKLAIISGIFINSDKSRTDLLLIGDDIKRKRLENFLGQIESEIGKPIEYTMMDTDEFKYRLNMYDRFLRDILEYPHEKLINKFNVS